MPETSLNWMTRVVAVERPDARRVIVAARAPAAQDVVLHEGAVAAPDLDAVATDVFEQIAANDHAQAARAAAVALADAVAVGAHDVAILDEQIVEVRLRCRRGSRR